jgi:hypothetical protein
MSEITKIETSKSHRNTGEQIAVAAILTLLIAVQGMYVAKHSATFATILAPAAFGIIAP